jgi:hypothetical protein
MIHHFSITNENYRELRKFSRQPEILVTTVGNQPAAAALIGKQQTVYDGGILYNALRSYAAKTLLWPLDVRRQTTVMPKSAR